MVASVPDRAAVSALFLILSLLLWIDGVHQPRIADGNGRGDDGVTYGRVADQLLAGQRPSGPAPFAYRLGMPLAAAALSRIAHLDVDAAFFALNLVALYALTALFYLFLRLQVGAASALGLTLLFLLPFHAPPRMLIFYPVLVDNLWLVSMLGALLVMARVGLTWKGTLLLMALTVIATVTRETGLLIPLVLIFSPPRGRLLRVLAVLAVGVVAFTVVRLAVIGTGGYSFAQAAHLSLKQLGILRFLQTWFVAFGPLVALVFADWRGTVAHLRENPTQAAYLVAVAVLSCIGGVNTVRFLYWAAPVVFVLVGRCLESVARKARGAGRLGVALVLFAVVVLQLVNTHFWEGFYDDYTAWERWGGMSFSPLRPVYLASLVGASFAVALSLRWLVPREPAA